MEHINPNIRLLAEFDGWIFSASGRNCIRGRNGTNRRLSDLHYDRWEWLFPVYSKLCRRIADKGRMVAIQSAINLGDNEMAAELCGKLAGQLLKENSK